MSREWVAVDEFFPDWQELDEKVEFYADGKITIASVEADESAADQGPSLEFYVNGVEVYRWNYEFMRWRL
jgi:hypothetical protein